jgi:Family of unknown function (DUF6174)
MHARSARLVAAALIALIAVGTVGCASTVSSVTPPPSNPASVERPSPLSTDPRFARIDAAEAQWVARRPSTYAFTYAHRGPSGVGWDWRYRVTALDGRVQVQWVDGYAQSSDEAARISVDGLFDLLRQELGGSGDLQMTFDADLGYPTEVAYRDPRIADSEATETVTDFVSGMTNGADATRAVLRQARATWKRWEPTAYEYVWRRFGPKTGPGSGTAWDVRHAEGGSSTLADPASDGALPLDAASVVATFDAADAALDSGAWVDVTVARTSGLPILVAVDPSPSEAGDEYWIRFTFRDTARENAMTDLQAAQTRWFAAGLQHFSYTWRYRGKYAPLTYGMTLDGEVATIRRSPGTPITEASAFATPRIDDTFRMIGDVLAQGGRVDATYDPTYGYPVRVDIDPFGDVGAPGTITIKAFETH